MTRKMLIDSLHPEETRVVVTGNGCIEEFDFESQDKKQLRGNIYLARVTRVEPSLQAAFVEYGRNRHGFLAFSEIHPDYYQIPIADRQALLRAELKTSDNEDASSPELSPSNKENEKNHNSNSLELTKSSVVNSDLESIPEEMTTEDVVTLGLEETFDEFNDRRKEVRRPYKIQEVIKRRQILLVQVVKEERGQKGASMTTYLSLAGRYSVLMPNTARGGGISRKITNSKDRERLRKLMKGFEVPQGMGIILRTAGESRTKGEIRRDYEYLMRLWEKIRNLTLVSTAPALVYEEGSLIKRSIRDLYNKDVSEILVSGEEGYREAKDFMRMLMPSHTKIVQRYRNPTPIFLTHGIENLLDQIVQPQVMLPSGGYIVINQTEALVSIDVNSGRSTREHSIEATALQTNLEAAEEVARQLRLRDLAGLVVIDFIDMEENNNKRLVEKRIKDCLKSDRARIQTGRISHFGLLEMSRQRIRSSILESTTKTCPQCMGLGYVRPDSSIAILVLRGIEEFLLKNDTHDVIVKSSPEIALYILNYKRDIILNLEKRFVISILFKSDKMIDPQTWMIIKKESSEKSTEIENSEQKDKKTDNLTASAPKEEKKSTHQHPSGKKEENREPQRDRKRKRFRRRSNNITTPFSEELTPSLDEQPKNEAIYESKAEKSLQDEKKEEETPSEPTSQRPPRFSRKRMREKRNHGNKNREKKSEDSDSLHEGSVFDSSMKASPNSLELEKESSNL